MFELIEIRRKFKKGQLDRQTSKENSFNKQQ
jgi:hypothetical protein